MFTYIWTTLTWIKLGEKNQNLANCYLGTDVVITVLKSWLHFNVRLGCIFSCSAWELL